MSIGANLRRGHFGLHQAAPEGDPLLGLTSPPCFKRASVRACLVASLRRKLCPQLGRDEGRRLGKRKARTPKQNMMYAVCWL